MKKKYSDFQTWLMKELRRAHYKWKPKLQTKTNARVSRGKYKCAKCGELFGPTQIDIDHIEEVIDPVKGFVDWNEYIERLFSPLSNYQVLCKACHKAKTQENMKIRRENK